MLCDLCHKNEAVIYVEQTNGQGEKRKINLCFECALERGISTDTKSIQGALGGLFEEAFGKLNAEKEKNNKMCPVCGTKLGNIISSGRTGCPECYSIFKNNIRLYLEKKGIKDIYKGSMPARLSSVHSVLTDRIMLQNKLNAAVEHEDYEKAAMYRDYLKALEKNPVSPGDSQETDLGAE